MGTSQSLKPSVKGQKELGNFTRTATLLANKKDYSNAKIGNLLNKYSVAKRAMNNFNSFGLSGIKTSNRLIGFFASVASNGLNRTLDELGAKLENMSVKDVVNFLINYCTENSSDFDDITAKAANEQLLNDLFYNIESIDEIEKIINNSNNVMKEEYLYKYFGYYIYEDISLFLYEKLYKKYPDEYGKVFEEIKNYIFTNLEGIKEQKKLEQVDWIGEDGKNIIKSIKEKVFEIFL